MTMSETLTAHEVARIFGWSEDHFRKHRWADFRRKGFPEPLPFSRRLRWVSSEVLAWKRQQEIKAGARPSEADSLTAPAVARLVRRQGASS